MVFLHPTPGIITRAYYTVPTNYTAGEDFGEDLIAAIIAARAIIKRFDYPGQTPDHTFSRAWVDSREIVEWADGTKEDRIVKRTEIFLPKE